LKYYFLEMTDLSEAESDASSSIGDKPLSPITREQMTKRVESLKQENLVLRMELDGCKCRIKSLLEENKALKEVSVQIHAKAEQEEEFISNTLFKKIKALKKEKETLALNYEQEEECLTNDLSRKLSQLRQEKAELAANLQQEQESLVAKLMRRLKKLEAETVAKQQHLDQLRREKVELENTLEHEQESLVNRLWKKLDKLEGEKRILQEKVSQSMSAPQSPMDTNRSGDSKDSISGNDPMEMMNDIERLRTEVATLKQQLINSQAEHEAKMSQFAREEQEIKGENKRLQCRLQMEVERRIQLCRHLSESESSLEMEDERHFNELTAAGQLPSRIGTASVASPYNTLPLARSPSPLPAILQVNVNPLPHPNSSYICLSQRCTHCNCILPHVCPHTAVLVPGVTSAQTSIPPTSPARPGSTSKSKDNDSEGGGFLRPSLP
ncbi:Coiled-coil domain-containing protein 6, partial [Trichinella spiralis]